MWLSFSIYFLNYMRFTDGAAMSKQKKIALSAAGFFIILMIFSVTIRIFLKKENIHKPPEKSTPDRGRVELNAIVQ